MKKLLLLGVAVVGVAVVAVAGVIVVAGWLSSLEVVETRYSWGEVTEAQTEVVTDVVLNNPNRVGVSTDNVGLDVDVTAGGIPLGHGERDSISVPEGRSTTRLVTSIDHSRIPEWWMRHISEGERSEFELEVDGVVTVLGAEVTIPGQERSRVIETDLLRNADSTEPVSLAVGPFSITIKERAFEWGTVTQQGTQITGTVLVNNGTPIAIPLPNITSQVMMNGIAVASGTTGNQIMLPPGQDTPVPVTIVIDHDPLREWWPTHVRAGERTKFELSAEAMLELSLPGVEGPQVLTLPLVAYADTFQTDILGGQAAAFNPGA